MFDETRIERAERKAKERAVKRKDRKDARMAMRKFVGDFTLMGKVVRMADQGEDVTELIEEWLDR